MNCPDFHHVFPEIPAETSLCCPPGGTATVELPDKCVFVFVSVCVCAVEYREQRGKRHRNTPESKDEREESER